MDHTYQSTMRMPSSYAVLTAEEMTYTDGGAVSITPQQVAVFSANLFLNVAYLLGSGAVDYAFSTIKTGLQDGLSLAGIGVHFWNRMNTWSKIASVGMGIAGGFYLYSQVVNIAQTVKSLVGAITGSSQQAEQSELQQQNLLAA